MGPKTFTSEIGEPIDLEVATMSADALRAGLRVSGTLTERTVALLTSALTTHMRAGRRYLRIDLTDARIADQAAVDALEQAHSRAVSLGGMVIIEGAASAHSAGTDELATLRDGALFLSVTA